MSVEPTRGAANAAATAPTAADAAAAALRAAGAAAAASAAAVGPQRMRIGVLYESDEWSDHKLAAELAEALAAPTPHDPPNAEHKQRCEQKKMFHVKHSASSEHPAQETSVPESEYEELFHVKHSEGCAQRAGADVVMVDMRRPDCVQRALTCDLLVSRMFASAAVRGNAAALERMQELLPAADAAGIPLVNESRAHAFEVSKLAASRALAAAGLRVPATRAIGLPSELLPTVPASELHPTAHLHELPSELHSDPHANEPHLTVLAGEPHSGPSAGGPHSAARSHELEGGLLLDGLAYPCVIKPDCSGRTTHTCIARSAADAAAFLRSAPAMRFIVQEYIAPERGYLTRAEVVDGEPALVVKRSVAENGLSAYRFGCTYAPYPDCPASVLDDIRRAAHALGFTLGSFDIIETQRGAYFIDANSVSNVSEDCTELLGIDLMRAHAQAIARRAQNLMRKDGSDPPAHHAPAPRSKTDNAPQAHRAQDHATEGGDALRARRARPPGPAQRAPAGRNETITTDDKMTTAASGCAEGGEDALH